MGYQSPNSQRPFDQFRYLEHELKLIVNRRWWRWLTCWFSGGTSVIVSYRLDRFGFLLTKKAWPFLRLLISPLFLILRLLGANHEIHYQADIGKGLKVLHAALGVVVAGKTIAGDHLLLTGGNCIGSRGSLQTGDLRLGNDVSLGANAVVLGPVQIGDHVSIGAGAVVIDSAPDHVVLAGVPAKIVKQL